MIKMTALIKRQRGAISESLQLFQQVTNLNPGNVNTLKQIGRSLYVYIALLWVWYCFWRNVGWCLVAVVQL